MLVSKPQFFPQKMFVDSVESTNNVLIHHLEKEKLNEGFILRAGFQEGGKGQGGAAWESENGKNLLFSFVLDPKFLKIEKQFYISMIVSLAIAETIRSYFVVDIVKIKWPNDIYVGNKKIAGVLIENAIQGDEFEWVVVGVGLNVNQNIFKSDAPNPVSLFNLLDKSIDLDEVLSLFESQFSKRYSQLQSGDFEALKQDYLNSLYQYKEWKNYRSNNQKLQGRILGLDQYGFLSMETTEGIRSFDVKEVEYL